MKDKIKEHLARIHAAVNSGTLDKPTVDDAVAQITKLVDGTQAMQADPSNQPPRRSDA